MSNMIKIGVLGCANIAKKFLIPAINKNSNFELMGIASRSKDKSILFASSSNTTPFYSYDKLINSDLDAIYIPLPNGLHYEWIKKSLNNKLHVLVEKSLACTLEQVKELNTLAKKNNLALMENFQFQFHEQLEFIRNQINEGTLGEIMLLRSCFGFPPFDDSKNIRYQKNLGGGALLDAGAYTIKISQIFLGRNIFVDSAFLDTPKSYSVDISGSATLKQNDGKLVSQIAFGFDHFYQNNLEVWGSQGKLSASRIFTAGPGIKAEVKIEKKAGIDSVNYFEDDHFDNMLNKFHKLIISRKQDDNEYLNNVNQARLISEIFLRSSKISSFKKTK